MLDLIVLVAWIGLGLLSGKFFLWAVNDPEGITEIDPLLVTIMVTIFPVFIVLGVLALIGEGLQFLLKLIFRR